MSRLTKWLRRRRNLAAGLASIDPFVAQSRLLQGISRPVIFDAGAHYGETALRYRACFPDAEIHCFEPTPASFERLRTATAPLDDVRLVDRGLADKPGLKTFHVNRLDGTNSLLPRPSSGPRHYPEGGETVGKLEIPVTTLDDYCREGDIDRVDILKMDIQGGELLALEGGEEMLSSGRVGLIYSEVMFVRCMKAVLNIRTWRRG